MAKVKSISDFKTVRKAKLYKTHIEAILKVLKLTQAGLKHFEAYTSVGIILRTIREEQYVLESHLNKMNRIIKEKSNE